MRNCGKERKKELFVCRIYQAPLRRILKKLLDCRNVPAGNTTKIQYSFPPFQYGHAFFRFFRVQDFLGFFFASHMIAALGSWILVWFEIFVGFRTLRNCPKDQSTQRLLKRAKVSQFAESARKLQQSKKEICSGLSLVPFSNKSVTPRRCARTTPACFF